MIRLSRPPLPLTALDASLPPSQHASKHEQGGDNNNGHQSIHLSTHRPLRPNPSPPPTPLPQNHHLGAITLDFQLLLHRPHDAGDHARLRTQHERQLLTAPSPSSIPSNGFPSLILYESQNVGRRSHHTATLNKKARQTCFRC